MMKSIQTTMLLVFIFTSSLGLSQSYIGAFIGLNSSKLSGDAPANSFYQSYLGINAGVNFDIKLAKSVKLSLQPSYSQEGTQISYNVSGKEQPVDSIKIRLNYFSFPILIKVMTAKNRFYAIGGFEAAALLDSYISSHDVKEDISTDVQSWNLAVHFGVGLRIPVGFPNLYVEARYAQGIINLTDEPLDTEIIPRVKTNGFKLIVGIEFPLQKSNK